MARFFLVVFLVASFRCMILLNFSAVLAGSVLPYDRLDQTGTMKKKHPWICLLAGWLQRAIVGQGLRRWIWFLECSRIFVSILVSLKSSGCNTISKLCFRGSVCNAAESRSSRPYTSLACAATVSAHRVCLNLAGMVDQNLRCCLPILLRSAGTHQRSVLFPLGNIGYSFVLQGNKLASRTCLLIMYSMSMLSRILLEQPQNSMLFQHPRVEALFRDYPIWRTEIWGGAYGNPEECTAKRH